MTLEEIKALDLEGVEQRVSQIRDEMNVEGADLDGLTEEVNALETRKKEIETKIETRKALEERVKVENFKKINTPKEVEKMTLKEVRSSEAYINAYAEYIKTKKDAEVRALLTDLVEGGSVPVPTMISDAIATAWERCTLVKRINKLPIKGSYEAVFELSADGAHVHVEGTAAPAEENLTFGTVKIDPEYIKKWITVSDKVLSLKGADFLNYLNNEITYRIQKLADDNLITLLKAAPATSSATAAAVPAVTVSAIDADTIFKGMALLADEAEAPIAIMTKHNYFNGFMGLKDTAGRPIYDVVSANGKPTYYINGLEVVFNSSIGDDTILIGDLDGCLATIPNGDTVEFVTDPYTLAEENKVKIVGKELLGLGYVKPKYFAKVTISA